MTKPKLAAVPEQSPKTRIIKLNGALAGHWVETRMEMTGREAIAMWRADEDTASALAVVGSRTVSHSFGGDILDQPMSTLAAIITSWTRHDQDSVVDPTLASDSDED